MLLSRAQLPSHHRDPCLATAGLLFAVVNLLEVQQVDSWRACPGTLRILPAHGCHSDSLGQAPFWHFLVSGLDHWVKVLGRYVQCLARRLALESAEPPV